MSFITNSLRTKVTIILIGVIAVVSSFGFYLYDINVRKKIYENAEQNIVSVLELLKDLLVVQISENGGLVKPALMQNIEKREQVIHSYLFSAEGTLLYPTDSSLSDNFLPLEILQNTAEPVFLKKYKAHGKTFVRVFMRIDNNAGCYTCYNSSASPLGSLVIDLSINEIEKNIVFTRKFSILFTLVMVLILSGFVIFLQYQFSHQTLAKFYSSINIINRGNLSERVHLSESSELIELGESFNQMLDNFQRNQEELKQYHSRELKNNRKLAEVGEMATKIAHEIGNSVTGIASALEVIIDEIDEGENKAIIDEIQWQTDRANNAISALLKYSHAGQLILLEQGVNKVVSSVIFSLKNRFQNKKIVFNQKLQTEMPNLKLDEEKIAGALLNLGTNAAQAVGENGEVTFSTQYITEQDKIHIAVSDTGSGIPEDKITEIFKPFCTFRQGGTGLGLAIVKDIVERHNGSVSVKNNPKTGATFTISLPVSSRSKNGM